MNLPQPGSPNHYWQQLGYTIERNGPNRTIRRPDGSVVDTGDGSHEDELRAIGAEQSIANRNRPIKPDSEVSDE